MDLRRKAYAITGYNPTADQVIEAFRRYVQEEAKNIKRNSPPEIYAAWYRLYQIPPIQGRGRPWLFKKLTIDHVFYPLAKSNGKILQLMRAAESKGGERQDKLFQFLNDIGSRALRFHLGRLVEMAEGSVKLEEYETKIRKRFAGEEQTEFSLVPPEQESDDSIS